MNSKLLAACGLAALWMMPVLCMADSPRNVSTPSNPALSPGHVPAAKPDRDIAEKVRHFVAGYRSPHTSAARRLRTVKDLVALGPQGIEGFKDLMEKELKRFDKAIVKAPETPALDREISRCRKVLLDLRDDPDLKTEQMEKEGLPALEQLTLNYRQRCKATDAHYAKMSGVAAQVQQLVDLLHALQNEWKQAPAVPLDDYLARAQKLYAQAAPAEIAERQKVFAENRRLAPQFDAADVVGMDALNGMRVMCDLNPLVYDPKLSAVARGHATDMKTHNFFSHESPLPDKKTPWDRAKLGGTTASGENIYMGSTSPATAIKAWFLSPHHYKNMMGAGHKRQGLGHFDTYWTQMFGV